MEDLKVLKAIISDAIKALSDDDKYRGIDLSGTCHLAYLNQALADAIEHITIVQNDISDSRTFAA